MGKDRRRSNSANRSLGMEEFVPFRQLEGGDRNHDSLNTLLTRVKLEADEGQNVDGVGR